MARRLSLRHPVLAVAIVAAAVRLWALPSFPLVITNDGAGYITWGCEFLRGQPTTLPPLRTPGYPLFLAGVFGTFGVGPFGVLIVQRILGVCTAMLIAFLTTRRHGPRWGMAAGFIAALNPGLWALESCVLTESLAVLLIVAAWCLSLSPGGGKGRAVSLGLVLGLGCLIRPSIEVLVPGFALGWLLRSQLKLRQRALCGVLILFALGVTTGPWLTHNAHRGINGLAGGGPAAFWLGMATTRSLDDAFPLPPAIAIAYQQFNDSGRSEAAAFHFLNETHAWDNKQTASILRRWTSSSIASRPGAYLHAVLSTLRSQLECRPPSRTDTGWFLSRLTHDSRTDGQPAANLNISGSPAGLDAFHMQPGHGSAARCAAWLSRHLVPGVPQVPLFIAAVASGAMMLARRDWGGALIVAGSGALFALHPVMLLPASRLAIPLLMCWIVLLPCAVEGLLRWRGVRSAAPVPLNPHQTRHPPAS